MKILLLGEFSGLFNSLKEGLVELGHDVTIMSDGDGFKNYPSDYSWRVDGLGRFNRYATMFKGVLSVKKFTGYDIVYVVTPTIIATKFGFGPFLFDYLKKHNGRVYLCGAGITAKVFKYWYDHKGTKYYKYVYGYIEDAGGDIEKVYLSSKKLYNEEEYIMSVIDGYIPIMYEYAAPFLDHPKYKGTVPIPINWKKYDYRPNTINKKVRVFHGITKTCKGGKFIVDAFNKLSLDYSDKVDFIVKGNIPFNDYIPYLRTMNIVADDANAYSLGMNALFTMAMGGVVLGGSEPQGNDILNYRLNNPALNITSNSDSIVSVLEPLLNSPETLVSLGQQSHDFVRAEHDYITIAKQYEDIWSN